MTERVRILIGGDLMTGQMVARRYGITLHYLWNWTEGGFPAPSLYDGVPYWRRGELDAFDERRQSWAWVH
jgi:hypothetical protein